MYLIDSLNAFKRRIRTRDLTDLIARSEIQMETVNEFLNFNLIKK